jgi:ATP-dependent DNA helicase RecG
MTRSIPEEKSLTVRSVLEGLIEAGLVKAHGIKKGCTYTFNPQVYQELGQSGDYVPQAGFEPIQQEQMVLQYVKTHGRITRKEAVELCRINKDQASRLLRKLTGANQLKLEGQDRASYYVVS